MADITAVVSVVVSGTVALVAVAAQVWQGHLTRKDKRLSWLRDRRAEAYISFLRLFEKVPEQVSQKEHELAIATIYAYGSKRVVELFEEWRDETGRANKEGAPEEVHQKAYEDSLALQGQIKKQISGEIQGR
jgi:hypothetical protein